MAQARASVLSHAAYLPGMHREDDSTALKTACGVHVRENDITGSWKAAGSEECSVIVQCNPVSYRILGSGTESRLGRRSAGTLAMASSRISALWTLSLYERALHACLRAAEVSYNHPMSVISC